MFLKFKFQTCKLALFEKKVIRQKFSFYSSWELNKAKEGGRTGDTESSGKKAERSKAAFSDLSIIY